MAAESAAVRATLQANGIVRPLMRLILAAAMDRTCDCRTLSAACTAAWALSNLLQDSGNIVRSQCNARIAHHFLTMHLLTSEHPQQQFMQVVHKLVCILVK